jgi:hypothetical protein
MSIAAFGLPALEGLGLSFLQSISKTSPQRTILWNGVDAQGQPQLDSSGRPIQHLLFPQIVAEERHVDRLQITRHPVEQGASIADHAIKLPAEVQIRGGWAFGHNTGPTSSSLISTLANTVSSIIPQSTSPDELQKLYGVLLSIQAQRLLVTLVTGKRKYTNMLLETLAVTTDERTENVLSFVCNFEELLIATTQTVSVPDASVMQNPQINGATVNQGATSLQSGSAINSTAANALISGIAPL